MTCTELLIKYLKTLGYDERYADDYVEIPMDILIAGLRKLEEKEDVK